jgi:hypothetical protein
MLLDYIYGLSFAVVGYLILRVALCVFIHLAIWTPRLFWASFCQMRDDFRVWKADFKRRFNSHYYR